MSMFSRFLHPEAGYQAGQDQLQRYFDQGQGYLQPFNQHGNEQYGNLQNYINSLMNPGKLQDDWVKGYTESESAKNAQEMAKQHGLDSASAMGLIGSTPALGALQAGTTQIGLNDRQNYLDNLMQKYMSGANLASNIYGIGANSAGNMANNAMNTGNNMAQMKFGETNAPGSLMGQLIGAGVGLAGSALGGPMGGALASKWNLSGGR